MSPREYMFGGAGRRIQLFEDWLKAQDADRLLVVGHSQYFKHMLQMDEMMGNTDAWEVSIEVSSENSVKWEKPKKLCSGSDGVLETKTCEDTHDDRNISLISEPSLFVSESPVDLVSERVDVIDEAILKSNSTESIMHNSI